MIKLENISIQYDRLLLQQEFLTLYPGKVTLIEGESGCGKTALLYRIALVKYDCNIYYDDVHINSLKNDEIIEFRRNTISFVLQTNDLIEHLTVLENYELYSQMYGIELDVKKLHETLNEFQLDISINQKISELSLGERKRFCIACALLKKPKVLILDEPTASLDKDNAMLIFQLLKQITKNKKCYVICTSHNSDAREYADEIYKFKNKKLICSKENSIHDSFVDTHRKVTISPKFAATYVKYFIKRLPIVNYLIIFFNIMLFIMIVAVGSYFNVNIQETQRNLSKQFDNAFVITQSSKYEYLDEVNTPFVLNGNNIYPLYKMHLSQLNDCYIVPYFKEEIIQDKINNNFDYDIKNGIYISYAASKALARQQGIQSENVFSLIIDDENSSRVIEKKMKINGILKKGVKQYYTSNHDMFIYIYYQQYYDMFKQYDNDVEHMSYTRICDEMDEAKQVVDHYKKAGYGVNDENMFYSQINDLTLYQRSLMYKILALMSTICLITNICMYLYSYMKRKKEYAVLLLNGVSIKYLIKILRLEIWQRNKYIIPIFGVLLFIMYYFHCLDFYSLLVAIATNVAINGTIMIIYTFLFTKFDNEKALRD